MNILDELYNGRIDPCTKCFEGDAKYSKLVNTAANKRQKLLDCLDDGQKKLLNELLDVQHDIRDYSEAKRFIQGFELGIQIICAAL